MSPKATSMLSCRPLVSKLFQKIRPSRYSHRNELLLLEQLSSGTPLYICFWKFHVHKQKLKKEKSHKKPREFNQKDDAKFF